MSTHLDRRRFTAALLAALGGAAPVRAAETTGLFWTATAPGKPPCTLFGYARIAAAVTPDIVADGERYANAAQRLIADVPNVRFPTVSIPVGSLPPIVARLSGPTAARLRGMLDTSFPTLPVKEKLAGITAVLMLRGEGQASPQPSVGGTISEQAQKGGKPISYLITPDEMKAAYHPPDLPAIDKRVDEATLRYLLGLRDIVGPLGAFEQGLYAHRRTVDLASADADMARHDVPGTRDLIGVAPMAATMIERAVHAIKSAQERAFLMLPVGVLTQEGGILAALRGGGVQVERLG